MNTSVPKRDTEQKSAGSGPVVSYQLSDEELAKYRAIPPKPAKNSEGERINKPVAQKQAIKEEKGMPETAVRFVPSKEEFLKEIAGGKSITKLERIWNMAPGSLHYWVGKWDLKGIKPDRAQQLLDETAINGAPLLREKGIKTGSPLELKASGDSSQIAELKQRLLDYETRWAQFNTENSIRIAELSEDRVHWQQEAQARQKSAAQFELDLNEARQAIKELQEERMALLATIERAAEQPEAEAVEPPAKHDNVNHPAHYTAGGIECIDAIEAATTGLTAGQAYCTGAAIKYLWRWSRKNGAEDLRKANWYINRLIGEVEAQ